MITQTDMIYLAGLSDGEAFIGVEVSKSAHYPSGFKVMPCFQIGLGEKDIKFLQYWQKELGGTIIKLPKVGYVWRVRDKKSVKNILLRLKNLVRMNGNKKRIELVLKIIDLVPLYAPTDPSVIKPLVQELRSYSKRTKGMKRYWT